MISIGFIKHTNQALNTYIFNIFHHQQKKMKLITPTCFFFVFQVLVDFPHHISIAQVPALVILPATDLLDFIYVTHKYKANKVEDCLQHLPYFSICIPKNKCWLLAGKAHPPSTCRENEKRRHMEELKSWTPPCRNSWAADGGGRSKVTLGFTQHPQYWSHCTNAPSSVACCCARKTTNYQLGLTVI